MLKVIKIAPQNCRAILIKTFEYSYLAVKRENKTHSPTKPANPAPPRPLITPITLSITVIPNIAPPPKRISTAIPRPRTVMIKPVKPLKKPLKYLNTLSIIKIIWLILVTNLEHNSIEVQILVNKSFLVNFISKGF